MNDIKECSSEELIDKIVEFIRDENTKSNSWFSSIIFNNDREIKVTLYLSENYDSVPGDTTVVEIEVTSYVMGTRTVGKLWWKHEVECVVDYSSVTINNLDNKYDFSRLQDWVDAYFKNKKEEEDGRGNAERNEQVCKAIDILGKLNEKK